MNSGVWIVVTGLVAAFAVIVLLAVSRSGRRKATDNAVGTDSGVYIPVPTDFGGDSTSASASSADNCDAGWSDAGGSDGGGDCGGGDGGGGGGD